MRRSIDIIISALILLTFLPFMLLTGILIYFFLGKPVLFGQLRVGLNGKVFKIIKFRTMKNLYDNNNCILPDQQRITKFGKFLRSTSIDELPTFINVLKGDMSIVGPRPLLLEYVPLYTKEQWKRHEVKPGITGMAQINGRNALSWTEKFLLDVWYVEHRNLLLDLKIIFLTIKKVLYREGISAHNHVTAEKFTGNN